MTSHRTIRLISKIWNIDNNRLTEIIWQGTRTTDLIYGVVYNSNVIFVNENTFAIWNMNFVRGLDTKSSRKNAHHLRNSRACKWVCRPWGCPSSLKVPWPRTRSPGCPGTAKDRCNHFKRTSSLRRSCCSFSLNLQTLQTLLQDGGHTHRSGR